MVDIICKMSIEEAKKELEDDKKKCRKQNILQDLLFVLILLLIVGISHVSDCLFPTIDKTYILCTEIIIILLFVLKCISFKSKEPDKKFSTRVELIEITPRIKEFLAVRYLCCFSLEYTLKDDLNELIQCFRLEGFSISQSRRVKKVSIDVDNFLILMPWKG